MALALGGTVSNSGTGLIEGVYAVKISGSAGTVTNAATILGTGGLATGVYLAAGGSVGNTAGLIAGGSGVVVAGGAGAVSNQATITGSAHYGVKLAAGGSLSNSGVITGAAAGVYVNGATGSVGNSGSILGTTGTANQGVALALGGTVSNSGTGLIEGAYAVKISGGAGTVTNAATIIGSGGLGIGIYLGKGGSVSNTAGVIAGSKGIAVAGGAGAVTNQATILGTAGLATGVYLAAGGSIGNTAGLIVGGSGVAVANSTGSVTNQGTIIGSAGYGIELSAGGSVTNTGGLIKGASAEGVYVKGGAGAVSNSGSIFASGGTASFGVALTLGGAVSNSGTGVIEGIYAVKISGGAGAVSNAATLLGTAGIGVYLAAGGSLGNTSGLIAGGSGVVIAGTAGSVTNQATIAGSTGDGVKLTAGGSVSNSAGGVITGAAAGVYVNGATGSVGNSGSIFGTAETANQGVALALGGTVSNSGTGLIEGVYAVKISGGAASVSNAATIVGTGGLGTGVYLAAAGIIVNFGNVGGVSGIVLGNSGANTIDNFGVISGGTGGTAGRAINLGAGTNDVIIEQGSTLVGVVGNFRVGDTFDLPFMSFSNTGTATLEANNVLQIVENGSTFTIALDPTDNFAGKIFPLSTDPGTGTLISEAVCFCRGTRILTMEGEVAVEDLRVGDRVMTLAGALKPIRWIGVGRDLVTRANKLARPVIVRAGALADGVPKSDLYLTHGHALYFDGVLIPVENLVNHRSIAWDEAARVVEYYHIEPEDHDIVFAEGAPAETYYDAGNRALFHNARRGARAGADKPTFAPVVNGGDKVERVWAALFARSGGRIATETTDDPDVHLMIDGVRLDPSSWFDGLYTFAVPAPPAGGVRLCSRSGIPSLVGVTRHDHRRLGVAISRIELNQPGITTAFDHDAPLFAEGGCHPAECSFVWTDGELNLPASLFAHLVGAFALIVHSERLGGMRYPIWPVAIQAA